MAGIRVRLGGKVLQIQGWIVPLFKILIFFHHELGIFKLFLYLNSALNVILITKFLFLKFGITAKVNTSLSSP